MKEYLEEYVEINGVCHYFLHYPKASPSQKEETILFLHGGPGQSEAHFAYCLRPHLELYNIVLYDQRGTGKTQAKNKSKVEDITVEALLDDLKKTVLYVKNKYRTNKILLAGHSWGSVLGTQFILENPHDVMAYLGYGQVVDMLKGEKIGFDVLAETVKARGNKRDLEKLEALKAYPNNCATEDLLKTVLSVRTLQAKYGYMKKPSALVTKFIKSPIFSLTDIPPLLSALKTNKNITDVLFRYSVWDRVNYQLPVFYILGRDDWQVPSILAAEYFDRIKAPKKGLYWIENAGHLPDVDNPVLFCKAIKEILDQI